MHLVHQSKLLISPVHCCHPRRGTKNVYKMPALLYLFGEEQHRARVITRMRAAGKLLSDPSLPLGSPGGGGGSGRGGASTSAAAAAAAPRLSQQQMEDSIDRLFDGKGARWRGLLACSASQGEMELAALRGPQQAQHHAWAGSLAP